MAFVAALPEIAEAGEAAGGAAEAGGGSGGGMMSKLGSLFGKGGSPAPGEQNKQQNVGESRVGNFMDAANSVRGALRGGVGGGVD
jgi:hypothetical protein